MPEFERKKKENRKERKNKINEKNFEWKSQQNKIMEIVFGKELTEIWLVGINSTAKSVKIWWITEKKIDSKKLVCLERLIKSES